MKVSIWAWRHSVARGWSWVQERECLNWQEGTRWLEIFTSDEPATRFLLAEHKPRKPPITD